MKNPQADSGGFMPGYDFRKLPRQVFAKLVSGFGVLRRGGWFDKWLLTALAIGVILGAQGFTWGRYDCLNLDRMALRNVTLKRLPFLHPDHFLKPPFYTYLNHFIARVPAEAVSKNMVWLDMGQRKQVFLLMRMGLARSLNLAIFAASVLLVFALARQGFGLPPARMAALLLATSAGFVPYQIFLTTDMALVFMMLASFACAVKIVDNPGMGISVAAGLLAGLAAATKYNGLLVAAALPAAHLLASRGNPFLACLRRPAAWVCGLCVPLGFLLGNPYAVLDWPTFSSDFVYNYKTTPVYNGATEGHSYAAFFKAFGEIFGWPGTWLVVAGVLAGAIYLVGPNRKHARQLWFLAAVVFIPYAWNFGSFPRIETRFVLPLAPFALLMASAGYAILLRAKWVTVPVVAAVLAYNLACGWWVGIMFRKDPRMEVLELAKTQVNAQDAVEVSRSIPQIQDLPGKNLKVIRIPNAIGISANFSKIFARDEQIQGSMSRWQTKEGPEWFTAGARRERNPDWIFWSSIDLEPANQNEYEALYKGGSGYQVIYDKTSPTFPWWTYPHRTEFLRNRVTVWKKASAQL